LSFFIAFQPSSFYFYTIPHVPLSLSSYSNIFYSINLSLSSFKLHRRLKQFFKNKTKKHHFLPLIKMARNSEQVIEEEDEDLSFCDLPVINYLTEEKEDNSESRKEDALENETQEEEEEFDFPSSGNGSLLRESEMCTADEVFFQGQILPKRLSSVSSHSGCLNGNNLKHDQSHNISRCTSRSESMDHGSTGGFTSNTSSRSSSTRSHNSSSSTTTSSNNSIRRITKSKPRVVQNNFLTCPSPKPQIRISTTRQGSVSSRSRNSTTRDFFRLGLVPTPEIGLQDLKVRRNNSVNKNSVSRNSSLSSSSSTNNRMEKQQVRQGFLERRIGGLLSGCKCSDETVSSNLVIIKSNSEKATTTATHAKKEKQIVLELKMKKKEEDEEKQQGKQAMSRYRTYEWLKDLSHAAYPPGT
jgi:hypothetical protein